MEKVKLEKFIKKYFLDSIESVVWSSQDGYLETRGISEDNNAVVFVRVDDVSFPEGTYGVYNTKKLLSLLSALGDEIEVDSVFDSSNMVSMGLKITDGLTTVNYILSDPNIIKKAPVEANLPKFEVTIPIDENFTNTFLRGKAALSDEDLFTVYSDGDTVDVIIGYSRNNTNRITISRPNETGNTLKHISFSTKYMKDILSANRDIDGGGHLSVSSRGIAYVSFRGLMGFTSKYYLVQVNRID
jgi:hypothetical protein